MSDTVRKDVREIVATAIAAAGLGAFTEALDGTEQWPIHLRKTPTDPDQCIVVACYGIGGPHALGVQVRVRGSADVSTSAEDRADAIRTALHGLADVTRGNTTLVLLTHRSTAEMGSDSLGRDEVAVNFEAMTDDPNTALDY